VSADQTPPAGSAGEPSAEPPPARRRPAGERRAQVISAAIARFAAGGYHGTSTESIARDVGVSQPYLFRLFKTKRDLFIACHDVAVERVMDTFERAAAAPEAGSTAIQRMGRAYIDLLSDRELLLFQMQSYAACSDPEIQAHVRARYGETVALVERLSGEPPEGIWRFFSNGMLLNVVASLDLDSIAPQPAWAAGWSEPGELIARADGGAR
jgi:AcrR family transcriptional regulator